MKKMFVRSLFVVCSLALVFLLVLFLLPMSLPSRDHLESRTANTAYNLKHAISAYYTEYRLYPVKAEFGDTTVDSSHELMDVLFGSDKEAGADGANPRKIAFFTGRGAKPLGEGRFRNGITVDKDGGGELWDPWGNHYRVCYDTSRDNHVESPEFPGRLELGSILVWSAGKDGDFETWEDNIRTW